MDTGTLRSAIEVDGSLDERVREELLIAAYRASIDEPSVVLMRNVAVAEADRILDAVVSDNGLEVAGLMYLSDGDEDALLEAARRARVVVATTERLRRRLTSAGLTVSTPGEGVRALGRDVPDLDPGARGHGRMASAGG